VEYLMLVRVDPEGEPDDPADTSVMEIEDWVAEGDRRGIRVVGDRLRPPQEARVVKRRAGDVLVTDGPFAETREWIAGFDLLQGDDRDEVVEYASRHPMAKGGRIELREVWPFDDGPAAGEPELGEAVRERGPFTFVQLVCDTADGEPWDARAGEEFDVWFAEQERDRYIATGGRLRPLAEVTTLRRRSGELLVTEGPFAETREFVSGFDLLTCDTLDQAADYASRHPMSRVGAIELRQVWPFEGE